MTIHLYDAMHIARITIETDPLGRGPRRIIGDMHAVLPHDMHIWCWDAPGGKKARADLYPPYKGKRKPQPDNIWPLIKVVREAMLHTPALQAEAPGFEADDLIATFVRAYPNEHIKVHSIDRDHAQLLAEHNNLHFDFKPKIDPADLHLYKTLVGDPSDNIAGIPGFGDKAWEVLGPRTKCRIESDLKANDARSLHELKCWTPRIEKWLQDSANQSELLAMWKITGLWDVPMSSIKLVAGTQDVAKATEVLQRYHHA